MRIVSPVSTDIKEQPLSKTFFLLGHFVTQYIIEGEEHEFEIIAFQTSSLLIPYFSISLACVC